MTLFGLHRAIQIAFDWEDYHLHAFKLHGHRYGRHAQANATATRQAAKSPSRTFNCGFVSAFCTNTISATCGSTR
jgi:hypothetical protein